MSECWDEGALRAYCDRELTTEDLQRVAAHDDEIRPLAWLETAISSTPETLPDAEPRRFSVLPSRAAFSILTKLFAAQSMKSL